MAEKWHVTVQPYATLTPIDPSPVPRGDGATWQRFKTPRGAVFAQVIEKSGLVMWMQRVSQ